MTGSKETATKLESQNEVDSAQKNIARIDIITGITSCK